MGFEWGRTPEEIDRIVAAATAKKGAVALGDIVPGPRQESSVSIAQPVGNVALVSIMEAGVVPLSPELSV